MRSMSERDQQRRVFQRPGVAQQLHVRRFQVAAARLVSPAEAAAPPDIGPALPGPGLGRALLEGIGRAGGVAVRRGHVQQGAEVEEMFLRRGLFVARVGGPLGDEFVTVMRRCYAQLAASGERRMPRRAARG